MKRFLQTAARELVLAGSVLAADAAAPVMPQPAQQAQPAPAQPPSMPKNPQIDIEYVVPQDAKFKVIYDRLQQHRALETLQEFLSPLRLPRRLTVRADQCGGAIRVPHQSQGPVTICYEFIQIIEDNAPRGPGGRLGSIVFTKDLLVAGAFMHAGLGEIAHAIFDQLEIPVWGKVEDAAANAAGIFTVGVSEEMATITLLGASWVLAQRSFSGTADFSDVVRSAAAQRFYNVLCIAYGFDSAKFSFLVKNNDLPKQRAERCEQDFRKLRVSFRHTFRAYLDPEMLKIVRAQNWSERLRLP
jgi:hypothetical protein